MKLKINKIKNIEESKNSQFIPLQIVSNCDFSKPYNV